MKQYIIVATGGFVYVGELPEPPALADFLILRNASNIRNWGTTKGLGELSNGPTKDTKLDPAGDVWFPWHSIISIHPVLGFKL